MTPEDFIASGSMLFGPNWKASAARACMVCEQTIHRYAKGKSPVSKPVEDLFILGLRVRNQAIDKMLDKYNPVKQKISD